MTGKEKRSPGEPGSHRPGGWGPRIPSVVMIPLGLVVGWIAGGWLGAAFGGAMGFFLWRSRA